MVTLFLAYIFSYSAQSFASNKHKVILSYFAPFDGLKSNHSAKIAETLKRSLEKNGDLEIVLCPIQGDSNGLNVAFHSDRPDLILSNGLGPLKGNSDAFTELNSCYEKNLDAQQVISLGVGSCETVVEGAAYNTMYTSSDPNDKDGNQNTIACHQKISDIGPDVVLTDQLNISAICKEQTRLKYDLNEQRNLLQYSNDMGSYVCNNLTYNFQNRIKTAKPPVSFSFIHVPLDLENANRSKCKLDPYKSALKTLGKDFNSTNFTNLISQHVEEFINTKNSLLNEGVSPELSINNESNCSQVNPLTVQQNAAVSKPLQALIQRFPDKIEDDFSACVKKKKVMQDATHQLYSKMYPRNF